MNKTIQVYIPVSVQIRLLERNGKWEWCVWSVEEEKKVASIFVLQRLVEESMLKEAIRKTYGDATIQIGGQEPNIVWLYNEDTETQWEVSCSLNSSGDYIFSSLNL